MTDDDVEQGEWPHPSLLVDLPVNEIRCGPAGDGNWEMLLGVSDDRLLLSKTMALQLAKAITDHYQQHSDKPFATLAKNERPSKRTCRAEHDFFDEVRMKK